LGLEEAQRLTQSEVAYLHYINDDQETIELVTWSTNTLKHCTAAHDSHYPVAQSDLHACGKVIAGAGGAAINPLLQRGATRDVPAGAPARVRCRRR
jgi:hypothetical protein